MSKIIKAVKIGSKGMRKNSRAIVQIIGQSLTFNDFNQLLRIGLSENQSTELNYGSVEEFELCAFDERIAPLSRIGTDFCAVELIRSLEWCAIATDTTATRYALGGVCWDENHIVGTDGRRMHVVRIGACDNSAKQRSGIIPIRFIKAVAQLVKLFRDDIVSIRITDKEVVFCGECWQLCSKLVEGRFPDWQQIVEPLERTSEECLLNVPTLSQQIAQTVKRIQLENKIAVKGLSPKSRKLHEDKIPQLTIGAESVNAEYIGDALDIVDDSWIEYRQREVGSAIQIGDSRICYSDRYSILAVVMPMSK